MYYIYNIFQWFLIFFSIILYFYIFCTFEINIWEKKKYFSISIFLEYI